LVQVRVRWYRYWRGKREQRVLTGREDEFGPWTSKTRQGRERERETNDTAKPSTGEDCTGVGGFAGGGGLWSATMQSMQGCRLSASGVCSPVSRSFRVLCV
jgi:hypothetical protein